LGRIPKYLKTVTNKFEGNVTEKVAITHLKKRGFVCQRFFDVNHEPRKDPQELVDHLERFKKSRKKFELKFPPKGFRILSPPSQTWDEFRRDQLEYGKWHIENVERAIRETEDLENLLKKKWGTHLYNLAKYCKWLAEQGGRPRYPDFIAKKNEEVFIVEVKSESKGKTAFFSESCELLREQLFL